jgi:hypothetical protein
VGTHAVLCVTTQRHWRDVAAVPRCAALWLQVLFGLAFFARWSPETILHHFLQFEGNFEARALQDCRWTAPAAVLHWRAVRCLGVCCSADHQAAVAYRC